MFGYDDAIVRQYPTIRAGVIHAAGLANGPSSPDLLEEFRAEQRGCARKLAGEAIAGLPSIAAWRRAFARFRAKPTRFRCAAEALLRRLVKCGEIPSINALVDIGNLVSIRYAMPVAVFDQADVVGSTTVRFAAGDERFTDLGTTDVVHPQPGEVIFADDAGVASARRWCWRQSAQSATGASTVEALIIVEGHHDTASEDVDAALADLDALLVAHQPGSTVSSHALSPTSPIVKVDTANAWACR